MGLLGKKKPELNIFASDEVHGDTKLSLISALEEDRAILTRQIEDVCRKYSKISGIKHLSRRKQRPGRAFNDWNRINIKN